MNAELVAVGAEMLRFGRTDTNGTWLGERLNEIGFEVTGRSIVDDDVERIAATVRGAVERADVVLVTGGIGPTNDDRTREGVARAVERPLERDPEMVARLQARFASRGRKFGPGQAKQADKPAGASWIDNPIGSAAGFLLEWGEALVAVFPGVPGEMRAMFDASLRQALSARGSAVLAHRGLRIVGPTEPELDAAVEPWSRQPGVDLTVLSGADGLELHIRGTGTDPAATRARVDAVAREIRARLGVDVYGSGTDTLAGVVGALLRAKARTIATAESCTAGLLAGAITAVPASSGWFRGGLVAYSDDLKQSLAGVSGATIEEHGAVSEAVARELARGARARCGADIGVGVTGIAGPGGGTEDKPVGLVHLALQDGASFSDHRRCWFSGDRETVRHRTVTEALDRVRRRLLGAG